MHHFIITISLALVFVGCTPAYQYQESAEDGSGDQGLGDKRSPFTYRLDGKNIMTTDPNYPALRIESVDANELRLFWYKLSVTLVYKRPSAFTGLRRRSPKPASGSRS